MVTSKLKMRTARDLELSFSGQLLETVTFHRELEILADNLGAAERLISSLGGPQSDPRRRRAGSEYVWDGSQLWEGVAADDIIEFP